MVTEAAAERIRRNADTRRATWLSGIQAIPDPELRAKVAITELRAAQAQLRAIRNQAMREMFARIGGTAGGGWEKVAALLGMKRPVAWRMAMSDDPGPAEVPKAS